MRTPVQVMRTAGITHAEVSVESVRIEHTFITSIQHQVTQTIMTKKTCTFLLLWCLCSTTTILAFLLSSGASIVVRHRPSSSRVLGTIGNDDFSKIFGKQEAAERRTRDLAREYHPPPKKPFIDTDTDGSNDESNTDNTKQQQVESIVSQGSDVKQVKTEKVIRKKYVPPPRL